MIEQLMQLVTQWQKEADEERQSRHVQADPHQQNIGRARSEQLEACARQLENLVISLEAQRKTKTEG